MPSDGAEEAFPLPKAPVSMSFSSWTRRSGQATRTLLLRRLMTPADGCYSTGRVTSLDTILADASRSKLDLDAQVVQRLACHPANEGTRFRKKRICTYPKTAGRAPRGASLRSVEGRPRQHLHLRQSAAPAQVSGGVPMLAQGVPLRFASGTFFGRCARNRLS
jgi:hypothetical protein